jgi:hypothetical protein
VLREIDASASDSQSAPAAGDAAVDAGAHAAEHAPTPPEERQIRIEDVRPLALRNNLDLRVELINPSIAKTTLTEEQARFEALSRPTSNFAKIDTPTVTPARVVAVGEPQRRRRRRCRCRPAAR